jgi:iron-sulfur cluster assembly protein
VQAGILITKRSAKEIRSIIKEQNYDDSVMIRIGAKGGGCAGMTYVLDFDKNGASEFDLTYEQHGVTLVIDKKSAFFMMGTKLDFNDGLLNRGFVFNNPESTGSCGCGTSFSV